MRPNPAAAFAGKKSPKFDRLVTVFFSYSHRDEPQRNLLEMHLAQLKRDEIIESWHDRRIVAGEPFDQVIRDRLEQADIILLLISPFFLASNYCYEEEMTRALERHTAGDAHVIPILLEHCEWKKSPLGELLAVPTDGKPVSDFPNVHKAFAEITTAIRGIAEGIVGSRPAVKKASRMRSERRSRAPSAIVRSSNLRVSKSFTQHDRDTFLDEAFDFLATFFEQSLKELDQRNPQISVGFKRVDATRFWAKVYRDGELESQCSIRMGGMHDSGIVYACEANSTNSYNESLTVENDGNIQYLVPAGFWHGSHDEQFSPQGAAEYFWAKLIEPLQRSDDR